MPQALTAGLRPDADTRASPALHYLPLDTATFPLGKTAPDAEPLVVPERVIQALGPDLAAPAYPLGLARGAALLREERLRIRLRAQRPFLPAQAISIFRTDDDVR
jgi:hypothetical protein